LGATASWESRPRAVLDPQSKSVNLADSAGLVLHKLAANEREGESLTCMLRRKKVGEEKGKRASNTQRRAKARGDDAVALLSTFLLLKQKPSPGRVPCMKTMRLTSTSVGNFDTTPQIPDVLSQSLCTQNVSLLLMVLSDWI